MFEVLFELIIYLIKNIFDFFILVNINIAILFLLKLNGFIKYEWFKGIIFK